MSEYAKRDHAALGAHYVRHISAMTAEALHTKSAIAGELAWRDAEIERLRRERDELAAGQAQAMADMQKNIQYLEGLRQGWSTHAADVAQRAADLEALVAELRRERDELAQRNAELAARLAEIEAQETVAWIEHELQGTGLRHLHFKRRPNALRDDVVAPVWTALIARPACDWPGKCRHQRPTPAAAPDRSEPDHLEGARGMVCRCRRCLTERGDSLMLMILCPTCGNKRCPHATDHRHACTGSNEPGQPGSWYGGMHEQTEPADPRTPPPGCRLLGDYERAQAGDMAYIGGIGGAWRPVRPRMGIIGATMDELSDGARVLALARPCRCSPDDCPKGGAK